MTTKDVARNSLKWLGFGLSVMSVVFVLFKLREQVEGIGTLVFERKTLCVSAWLAVVYGFSGLLLAYSWRNVLRHLGVDVDYAKTIAVYGISQLGKYIPGNIFQFVGRQVLAFEGNLPGVPLAKSALWEIVILAISGLLFIPLALPGISGLTVLASLAAFVSLLSITAVAAYVVISPAIARATISTVLFLATSGAVFLAVVNAVNGPVEYPLIFAGAFVVAWLAGFLTPGAPAGVGIREVVLYVLLGQYVAESDLLAAILLARLINVAGDVLFYLCAVFLGSFRKKKRLETSA